MSAAPATAAPPDWDRLQRLTLAIGAAGAVLFVLLGLARAFGMGERSPVQFFLAYLTAYTFWLGVPLGCLVLSMIDALTGGAWGVLLRRVLGPAAATLGLMAVLFLPLAVAPFLGVSSLYPWARPPESLGNPDLVAELREKAGYLNGPFFVVRAVVYFACWLVLLAAWRRWPVRVSGPGLVLYGLTITFAAIDWVMSLEPTWYSTIYPVVFALGQILTGFAFAVAVLAILAQRPPLAGVVRPEHLRDLGSLLLAFVLFWAYVSFSQFLLIWVGNLPEEVPWYLRRSRGGWQWVALALAVLHFALPFLLLLFRDLKEDPRSLAAVAVGLLVLRFVDVFWWVEPAYPHDGQYGFWLLDLAALTGLGGLWGWWFLGRLRRAPLWPPDGARAEVESHA